MAQLSPMGPQLIRYGMFLLAAAGMVMFWWGWVVWRRHRRFMRDAHMAPGVVSRMQTDHQGDDDAVIAFTPAAGGAAVELASRFDVEGGLELGQRVEVLYDPADPRHAIVRSGNTATHGPETGRIFIGLGLLLAVLGAVLAVILPPVQASHDDMLAAGRQFVAVVRSGDVDAIRAAAAPDAMLDESYLLRVVKPAQSIDYGSSMSGFEDGCARAILRPGKKQLVMLFVKHGDVWRVHYAAADHQACEEELDTI